MNKHLAFISALALSAGLSLQAQNTNQMVIQANKLGAEIQPTMYGHFFEDINYGADGGLYAELIKNRSFEFPQHLMGWDIFGNVTLQDDGPFEKNPHYVRLGAPSHPHKRTGIENEGFFGIGIKANEKYRFTVWARGENQKIQVELIDNASMGESQVITSQDVNINSKDWKKYEVILTPTQTQAKAHLRIFLASPGTVDLEHVSLFPVDTWKGRENGLRKDLVQALADTKPGIFRFPGGCIVEGTEITDRYNWKNSVGPVENRPLNSNRWEYTFPYRFFPDYFQSYGMGFYELFLLAEDMGAEPLPVLNCGLACQYQNDDPKAHVPVDQLDSYIQDALDLIEFANGDTNTKWGKLRADMGHPAPFNLKFMAIGNEQWGPEYPARLKPFVEAIRKAHPEIKHGDIRVGFNPDEEIGLGAHKFDVEKFGAKWAYTMDGGEVGELEFENFNAASAKVLVKGRNVHPGYAKNKMINSLLVANEYVSLLPSNETPGTTEGYEGFYHLIGMEGEVEHTVLSYIVRDHDREKFEARKQALQDYAAQLNQKYGEGTVCVELKDQYYNMRQQVEPLMHIIDIAFAAMQEAGVTPKVKAIRGGTDGAQLSFKGLPCPNIFAGGLNFHGRYEFVPIPSIEKAMKVVVKIAELTAKRYS